MKVKFLLKIFVLLFFLVSTSVLAQTSFEISYPAIPGVAPPTFGTGAATLISYIQYIFYFAILVGIILSFVIIVFGGLRYLYSRGNPQIIAQVKSQIFNAFLGLGILLFSLTILNSISPEFSRIEPTTLTQARLAVNILRRFRINLNWQQLVQLISPTSLPLEVSYPMVEGFRPTAIPLETWVAPTLYPLHQYVARFVKYIYDFALILGVILAFFFLMLGGVKWLTAGGNIGRVKEAKEQIFASLLGLLLFLSSWLILRFFRPEYTVLSPPELPDTEVELEPGVYICTQPMNPDPNLDPMIRVLRCRDQKISAQTYGAPWPVPNCLFPKGLAKEIKTFAETQCLLIKTSQTLPVWLIGEPVDINLVREQLESVSSTITDVERDEIIQEWEEYNQSPFVFQNLVIYINGHYGLVLHEERDFKGRGEIILKHSLSAFSLPAFFVGGDVVDFNLNYRYRYERGGFRSITLFEDSVIDCLLKTQADRQSGLVDISNCLGITSADDMWITFYNLPDFGALEEKIEESKELINYPRLIGGFTPNLHLLEPGSNTLDPRTDPCYSVKLPEEEKWVVVVGADRTVTTDISLYLHPIPIYVFDKSQRNLEATYVGSFCQQGERRIPCITHFFAWPGKILKEKK